MSPTLFIDRPILATVLSTVITLAGALAVTGLPVSQYPKVTPPTIQIDCNYPGASAQVVSETIAAPIEQQVNGVEDMLYMSSQSTSDGSYSLTVTFRPGTDLNMAQVRVQNRTTLSFPQLPEVVRATGITVRKRSPELLLTIGVTSPPEDEYPNGRYDQLHLSNYAVLHLREELQRLPGISDVTIFGQRDYSMRVWLDPERMSVRNLSAGDVVTALQQQNIPVAAGHVGQPPGRSGQSYQIPLTALGRLETVEQFEQVVVKTGPQGQLVKIKDLVKEVRAPDGPDGRRGKVLRPGVELGAKSSDVSNLFDRKPTVGLAIFILPEANALEVAEAVKLKMEEMKKEFPPGIDYEVAYDTSPFIGESIAEVVKSLRDAIILVALVVLLFLQTWRAALIPLAAVPVAIVGTFAAMALAGFTINNLTLFGLVLAVGIVVDDAIVVVEAVQHQLEHGYAPREATVRAMADVSGPIFAVGVVLGCVFLPCAFLPGIVGSFFRQFALTIAVSTAISTFNSLTLSPALCALLLKAPRPAGYRGSAAERAAAAALFPLSALGRLFNRAFDATNRLHVRAVGLSLRVPLVVLVGYGAIVAAGVAGFRSLPTGFIPQQDKGYMILSVQLPDAASAERTVRFMDRVSDVALTTEIEVPAAEGEAGAEWGTMAGGAEGWFRRVRPIKHVNAVAGNSFVLSAYGSNFGSMFVILEGFDKRRSPKLSADAIAVVLRGRFAAMLPEAQVQVFGAPAVSGLGRAGGFRIMIEDRGSVGPEMLQGQTEEFIRAANQQKQVVGLFTVYKTDSPQLSLDIDINACVQRAVEVGDVYAVLQGTMGSQYTNDFNRFGRTWQVNVQGDAGYRNQVEDVRGLKVRNARGEMVPLGSLLRVRRTNGPLVITRYNMYPAAPVNGSAAPGTSTGDAIAVLEKLAEQKLPQGRMAYEWTEITFIEKLSRKTGAQVFALSVVAVFLVLAALYESWAFPLAVILVVPVCVACSLGAVWITDPGSTVHTLAAFDLIPIDRPAGSPLPPFLGEGERVPADWLPAPDGSRGAAGPFWFRVGHWLDAAVFAPASRWVLAQGIGKQDVNIFTQVGFVVLVGLACKNAILIVEFAKIARDRGDDLRTAVLEACQLRFRPIMMTSVAFMLGVLPLAVATGAGAEMRQALGVAVLGGMIGVTAFGIILTPVFFALVDRLTTGSVSQYPWVARASRAGIYTIQFGLVAALYAGLHSTVRAMGGSHALPVGLFVLAGAGLYGLRPYVRKVVRKKPDA
jgi:multidrug efflux pump